MSQRPLLPRRNFVARGAAVAGAAIASPLASRARAQSAGMAAEPWQTAPGTPAGGYGQPSRFEKGVQRHLLKPYGDIAPGTGPTFTPIESLEGGITPSGLHFVRN